jgi:hypothetical protein
MFKILITIPTLCDGYDGPHNAFVIFHLAPLSLLSLFENCATATDLNANASSPNQQRLIDIAYPIRMKHHERALLH